MAALNVYILKAFEILTCFPAVINSPGKIYRTEGISRWSCILWNTCARTNERWSWHCAIAAKYDLKKWLYTFRKRCHHEKLQLRQYLISSMNVDWTNCKIEWIYMPNFQYWCIPLWAFKSYCLLMSYPKSHKASSQRWLRIVVHGHAWYKTHFWVTSLRIRRINLPYQFCGQNSVGPFKGRHSIKFSVLWVEYLCWDWE